MEYKFISDPELRDALNNAREENIANDVQEKQLGNDDSDLLLNKKQNLKKDNDQSSEIKLKTRPSSNKKFDSLKSNKKRKRKRRLKTPSIKSLAISTKQLASMLRTGLPLLESLNILSEATDDKTLKIFFKDASLEISRGSTYVSVLEKYPEIFDDMYVALVSAGEAAGLLPSVLEREALLLQSFAKIKGQIQSALAYPIAIFILTIIVIIIMLVFVIPIFVDMYESSGAQLPLLTQTLVNFSNTIKEPSFTFKALPIGIFSIFMLKKQSQKEYFLNWRDSTLLKIPITKDLVTKSCLANFSRTLSALNSAGVPILESLLIAKRTLGNRVFARIVDKMNIEIQAGQPIYRVLAKERIIPIMFASMFRVGEETGELSEMINKLAEFYEEEVSGSVKSVTSIIEPLMIVFVASIVAFILVAMYLPMFNMMSTVS